MWQSCATCAYVITRQRRPMVVRNDCVVPRFTVQYSRTTVSSPTSTQVSSPWYLRSCGSPPRMLPAPTLTRAPSFTLRSSTTPGPRTHPDPTVTCGPTIACGPTSTSSASWASGATIAVGWIRRVTLLVHQRRHHFGLAHHVAVHVGDPLHAARLAAELDHLELAAELVSRHNRPAEFHVVERHEVDHLALVVLAGHERHEQHPADLRHRFDDQHARHHGVAGEVPLEERLVVRDVLDPDDALLLLDLEDPVDEQHRVAVGDDGEDVADVHHGASRTRGPQADGPPEGDVAAVARPGGDDVRAEAPAKQRQVAEEVRRLVAHELVGPAQRRADDRRRVEHDGVLHSAARDEPLRPQRLDLVHEAEGARRRELAREHVGR